MYRDTRVISRRNRHGTDLELNVYTRFLSEFDAISYNKYKRGIVIPVIIENGVVASKRVLIILQFACLEENNGHTRILIASTDSKC